MIFFLHASILLLAVYQYISINPIKNFSNSLVIKCSKKQGLLLQSKDNSTFKKPLSELFGFLGTNVFGSKIKNEFQMASWPF